MEMEEIRALWTTGGRREEEMRNNRLRNMFEKIVKERNGKAMKRLVRDQSKIKLSQ